MTPSAQTVPTTTSSWTRPSRSSASRPTNSPVNCVSLERLPRAAAPFVFGCPRDLLLTATHNARYWRHRSLQERCPLSAAEPTHAAGLNTRSSWPAGVTPTAEYEAALAYLREPGGHLFIT